MPTASSSVLAQLAPDSTLALSKDGGDTWRVPWKLVSHGFGVAALMAKGKWVVEEIPTLECVWRPWRDAEIFVETVLLAPSSRWPDWHVRLHRIVNRGKIGRASCRERVF